jgi:hypothetical protein
MQTFLRKSLNATFPEESLTKVPISVVKSFALRLLRNGLIENGVEA